MNEVLHHLGDMLLVLSSAWILKKYFKAFFVEKQMHIVGRIIWILYLCWQYMLLHYISTSISFNLLISVGFILCICLIQYQGSIGKKVVFSFSVCSLWTLVEYIVGYLFLFSGIDYMIPKIIGTIITQLILLFMLMGLNKLLNKENIKELPKQYNILLLLILCGSLFVVTNIFSLSAQVQKANKLTIMSVISTVSMFVINISIFAIYIKLSNEIELKKINAVYQQQIESYDIYLNEKAESDDKMRRLCHDMKQHFIYIMRMAKLEEHSKIIEYTMRVLNNDIKEPGVVYTDNMVLDAIINYKAGIMQKNGIDLKVVIEVPTEMNFQSTDLCVIVGNILDNAIEGCLKINDNRNISLLVKYLGDNLLIRVINTYDGHLEKDKKGNIKSTKDDPMKHGIGLPSIEKAIQKYDGTMKIKNDSHKFEISVLLYEGELRQLNP